MNRAASSTLLFVLISSAACSDDRVPTAPLLPAETVLAALNPAYGTRYFYVTGFSYGPNGEEYDSGSCQGTYQFVDDSVQVWSGTPPAFVETTKYKRMGCAPGSWSDGPYVGGNVNFYISNSDVSGSIIADGAEDEWVYDVPKDPSGTLYLSAYADYGYTFIGWQVYPSSGGSYFVSSSQISRPLDSSDWHFHAEFQKTP